MNSTLISLFDAVTKIVWWWSSQQGPHTKLLSNQKLIMNELIREYLLFNDCGDTASVFIPGMMLACFITPAGCPDRGCCWSRNAIFFATTPEQHLSLIEWESINLSIYSAWKCQKGFDWFLLSLMNNSWGMVERIA
jgi:hypothetical protein